MGEYAGFGFIEGSDYYCMPYRNSGKVQQYEMNTRYVGIEPILGSVYYGPAE